MCPITNSNYKSQIETNPDSDITLQFCYCRLTLNLTNRLMVNRLMQPLSIMATIPGDLHEQECIPVEDHALVSSCSEFDTFVSRGDSRMEQEPDKAEKMPVSEPVEEFVYRDFSRILPPIDNSSAAGTLSPVSSSRVLRFPSKLEAMLSNPEFSHIVSWMPHGRSWKVHNIHLFVKQVIPGFFEYNNYKSFIRLVNAWAFRRILKGPDHKSYYHEVSFQVNRESLVARNVWTS
jgi:hypothetical protein